MTVNKKHYFTRLLPLSVIFISYLIATFFHSELWGNILSPLNAFAAGGLLCFVYRKTDRTAKARLTLLLFSLACFAWGAADFMWALMSFTGKVPKDSRLIMLAYAFTNVFLLSALIFFAVEQFKKWDFVQYSIDLIISGFLSVLLFWIVFMQKDASVFYGLLASDFTSVVSILTDIFICITVFSWFLSAREGKIPAFLRIISFGLIMFAIVDMFYYYIDYNGLYTPNTLVDFAYVASFYIIVLGALWKTYKKSSLSDLSFTRNIGGHRHWFYLLLYPFFAIFFSVSGMIKVRMNYADYLYFGVPIFLYWVSCKYIWVSLEKEAFLKHQNEILEQRVEEQVRELKLLSNQDTLTMLFNRRYFLECLEKSTKSLSNEELMAVLFIDMDRFKTINDTYGHDVGDRVLSVLAHRIIEWNTYGAMTARLGGDEFAVMFVGKYTQKDIEDFCIQLTDLCAKPVDAGEVLLNLTMSIGVALASETVRDANTLMKHADIAMYSAKLQGYNKYRFYNSLLDSDFKRSVEVESLLRQADIERDFKLFYQPLYSLPDTKLVGAEALLRWENHERGFIPPNVFIPIAEEIDYIFRLGRWVMQETIRQSKTWNDRHSTRLKVGFNISPKQFCDKEFIALLEILLSAGDLDPEWIDAEITESVMIKAGDDVDDIFTLLRTLGVSVSIDDFGSGYSGLNYLNKYSFDRIKIDKALIDSISISTGGANIVRAAVNMAHAAGIQIIAEGVENDEQLKILKELGCDQVQGYLLGRPVPAEVFEQLYILGSHA